MIRSTCVKLAVIRGPVSGSLGTATRVFAILASLMLKFDRVCRFSRFFLLTPK